MTIHLNHVGPLHEYKQTSRSKRMDSEFMIPLGGRRDSHIRSPPAYAALTPGTSFTLPNPTTDKRFDEDAMVSYNSLPNIDKLATGSHLSLTRSLPRLKERMANRLGDSLAEPRAGMAQLVYAPPSS